MKRFIVVDIDCDHNSHFDTMVVVAETEKKAFELFIKEMNSIADYYEYSWLGETKEYSDIILSGIYIR